MTPVIQIQNLSRRFGKKTALSNVSFQVPRGCVFALLGENGAGKTTLIKNVLGLDRSGGGHINVLGFDPKTNGIDVRRRVGYVPDSPALYDWMTVGEAGWFTAGFYPIGFEDQFHRLCSRFGLDQDVKIKTLSKGGKAKVSLALSMASQPELLIMDEPTSGLDTLVRRNFLESMVDVAASGRTVLLSSHQISEVERVADYVCIINQGKILACQPLQDLKDRIERWVVSFESHDLSIPGFKGNVILHEGKRKRRQQLMIQDPGPDALWQLRDAPGISNVEVHTPSLEEIFVGFLKSNSQFQYDQSPAQVAASNSHGETRA